MSWREGQGMEASSILLCGNIQDAPFTESITKASRSKRFRRYRVFEIGARNLPELIFSHQPPPVLRAAGQEIDGTTPSWTTMGRLGRRQGERRSVSVV